MCSAFRTLSGDQHQLTVMRQRARALFESDYSQDDHVSQLKDIYLRVMQNIK